MINALPKYGEYVFNPRELSVRAGFDNARERLAQKLQNPRLARTKNAKAK